MSDKWQEFCITLAGSSLDLPDVRQWAKHFGEGLAGNKVGNTTIIDDVRFVKYEKEILDPTPTPTLLSLNSTGVHTNGDKLFVDGNEYKIKGVTLSTVGVGQDRTDLVLNLASVGGEDIVKMMADGGINTVRTYVPPEKDLLDAFANHSIRVIVDFSHYDDRHNPGPDIVGGGYKNYVNQYQNHSAILMWELGNEYNYAFRAHPEWLALETWWNELKNATGEIHKIDSHHPVSTTLADMNLSEDVPKVLDAAVDIIGLNAYRWDNDSSAVRDIRQLASIIPMYLSEAGADSYNTTLNSEDQGAQAMAVANIYNSIKNETGCLGITFMTWQDEWYKAGNLSSHDQGGYAGSMPYDNYSNEEYYGHLDINHNRKQVYYTMKDIWAVLPNPTPTPTPTEPSNQTLTPTLTPTPITSTSTQAPSSSGRGGGGGGGGSSPSPIVTTTATSPPTETAIPSEPTKVPTQTATQKPPYDSNATTQTQIPTPEEIPTEKPTQKAPGFPIWFAVPPLVVPPIVRRLRKKRE